MTEDIKMIMLIILMSILFINSIGWAIALWHFIFKFW